MNEKQWRKHQCPQCLDYLDESGMHVCNQRINNLIKNVEDWKDKNYEHDISIAYDEWIEIGKKEMSKIVSRDLRNREIKEDLTN